MTSPTNLGAQIDGTAEELMAEARRVTSIDIVDRGAVEPLERLIESHNRSANFTPGGAAQKRKWLLRILMNRLRRARDFQAHPEIAAIELRPPLLINSLPRTGSTKTQKMMAATGAFNWLPYWMCMNSSSVTGVPGEDVSERIDDIARYADWFNQASPDAKFGHVMVATEPEEEAYVLMQHLVSHALAGFAAAPDYLQWAGRQDLGEQYRYLADTLRYLIWQGLADAEKPFLLKCVINIGFEAEIREALPGVNIAMTHRDPAASVPSAARLGRVFRTAYSDAEFDMSGSPRRWAATMGSHLAYREQHPDEQFLDLDYVRIRDHARSVAAEMCEFAGVEPTGDVLSGVDRWEAGNPQHKQGSWSYAPEDFGFTAADVRDGFTDYYRWISAQGIAAWGS